MYTEPTLNMSQSREGQGPSSATTTRRPGRDRDRTTHHQSERSRLESHTHQVRQHLKSLNSRLEGLSCWNMGTDCASLLSTLHTSVHQILSWKLERILVILLTIGLLALLPVIVILLAVMLLIRHVVARAAKHFRPDLGSIIPTRSAGFGADLVYNKIPKYSVIVPLYLDGHLGLGDFRARLSEALEKKDMVSGSHGQDAISVLRYPELKQHVYSWLGILFWRWDRHFKIENHANLLHDRTFVANSGETLSEVDLSRIGHVWASKPFRRGQSPWEFLLVHHTCVATGKPRTLVIFRIHHALGDGFSILKFCTEELSLEHGLERAHRQESRSQIPREVPWRSESESMEQFVERCRCQLTSKNVWKLSTFIFRAAYDMANGAITTWDFNCWKLPERKLRERALFCATEPIPLERLKKIKNEHQVALGSLLLAVFSGAVSNYMQERSRRREQIPEHVHCMFTLPFPGHSGRLTNHLSGGVARLPLSSQLSPQARLADIDRDFEASKNSTLPILAFYGVQVSGISFAPITNLLFGNFAHTCAMSNFAGPGHTIDLAGYEVLDGSFVVRIGGVPISFTALSYKGNIRLVIGMDEAILPISTSTDSSTDLAAKIMEEVQALEENLVGTSSANVNSSGQ